MVVEAMLMVSEGVLMVKSEMTEFRQRFFGCMRKRQQGKPAAQVYSRGNEEAMHLGVLDDVCQKVDDGEEVVSI